MPQLIARGQATIHTQQDSYTITQSLGEYIFSTPNDGRIDAAVSFSSTVRVSLGGTEITDFTIGAITKPAGFSAITVNSTAGTITYSVSAGTATLADSGTIRIPVIIAGETYYLSFAWSKAKAGVDGPSVSQTLPGWIEEWDSGKTQIGGSYVITPKIFAGVKNADNTITGTAIGKFTLQARNAQGQFQSEEVNGVYGFRDGYKTFSIDTDGNVTFGRGNESIHYNALTGKIEFGSAVSMQWIGATYIDKDGIFTGTLSADTVNAICINANQITAGTIGAERIDVASLKAELITAANIEALTLNVTKGKIGGWTIDADSIHIGTKSNVFGSFTGSPLWMTIGSKGLRGFKWALEDTGAGQLAGGNIAWDINGNVTFGSSVSLYWKNEAQGALDNAMIYADQKDAQTLSAAQSDATTKTDAVGELARAMAYGRMLYRDPTFINGLNDIKVFNNSNNGNVVIERISDTAAPNDNKLVVRLRNKGLADPDCGGFSWQTPTQYCKIYITRLIAKIPVGRSINFHTNSIGTGGSQSWLTSTAGTGDWTEYICKVACGTANFSTTHFFTLSGTAGSSGAPADWYLAYATVFDITSSEKLTTTIDADGIYTGTLSARQVNAVSIEASSVKTGFLSADRIAAGSIRAEKLDAADIKAGIINTDYINGLTLTFDKGVIGGWTIAAGTIFTGNVGAIGSTPIQLRSASAGSGYIYSGAYKPYGLTLSWYQSANAGHLVFGQVMATGSSVKTGFCGLQMMSWDNQEYFTLSANTLLSGSKEVYNRIAGWAFDHQKISKNNVSLGADGSITNGTKWSLGNDGSGSIAGGNIVWDAAGNITFSAAVAVNWKAKENRGEIYAKGTGFYNLTPRLVVVNGTTIVNNSIRGLTLTVLNRADLSLVSSANYDVYANEPVCNTLADVLNALTTDKIVILTSYDCILINAALSLAIQRCGGTTLTLNSERLPFAFIGIPAIGSNNGLLATTGATVSDPPAEVSTLVINGMPEGMNTGGKQKTYIDGWGIYTGTLTANQVNAVSINASSITTGTLAAARIAAGSITADKLNVANLQATLVTASHIEGLTLTFNKGTIGGWVINSTSITSSTGSIVLDNANRRIALLGSGATVTSGARLQLHHTSTSNFGLQVLDSSNSVLVNLGYTNSVAGWNITVNSIYKGSVYLGSDGSIYHNSSRWRLNNDGSGQIASGNISWNASGVVTFASAVSLNWTSGINAITTALGGSTYTKLTKISSTGIYTGTISASQITVDSTLVVGGNTYNGSISVRNASNSVMVTLDRSGITAIGGKIGGWTLSSSYIYSGSVYLNSNGSIYNSNYWRLNSDGSGRLANGKFIWDAAGNITAEGGTFKNVSVTGIIKNPFMLYDSAWYIGGEDPSVKFERYDHVALVQSGSWTEYVYMPWTIENNGRRILLVNYQYDGVLSNGVMEITAPTGQFFFEDGISKKKITFSREVLELVGYGDTNTFHGWIVLSRKDIMTNSKYGSEQKSLAQGTVTCTSTSSATIKYKTFDGSTMSVSRSGKGLYYVYLPSTWGLTADKYMVMLTGKWGTIDNTPIYATVKTQYSYYFLVQTQDDAAANDGSFNFVVVSTADWK